MIFPVEGSIITEKNRVQKLLLEEANGDLKEYSRIVKEEADEIRKKIKGRFTTVLKMQENK
jgi:hypothetical protein